MKELIDAQKAQKSQKKLWLFDVQTREFQFKVIPRLRETTYNFKFLKINLSCLIL